MANKKQIEARERARKKQQTERMIQIIGGVVLVLFVAGIIWLVWSGGRSNDAAVPTPEEVVQQSDAAPPMTIDVSKQYIATFTLAKGGEFVVELFDDQAPTTVNNFVYLARSGFYDGTTFHRVLEGFMAQGGDPTGTGSGGPGYQFEDEFSDLTFDQPGLLAMANSGPNTNGSQFFITYVPTPHLNGLHTIFGQVTDGMDVVNEITRRDPDQNPDFAGDAIETIIITEQ